MKKILPFLILLIGCQHRNNANVVFGDKEFEKSDILVVGQSNGLSQLRGTALRYSTSGRVKVNDPTRTMVPTVPTIEQPQNASIAWIALGESIVERTNQDITITNMSVSSSNIYYWRHDIIDIFKEAVNNCFPRYILWIQGEQDAVDRTSEEDYYQSLKFLIQNTSGPRWIVAMNGLTWDSPIRRAQQRIINEGLALQGPDLDALRNDPSIQMTGDRLHFSGTGFKSFADSWIPKIS